MLHKWNANIMFLIQFLKILCFKFLIPERWFWKSLLMIIGDFDNFALSAGDKSHPEIIANDLESLSKRIKLYLFMMALTQIYNFAFSMIAQINFSKSYSQI